MSKEQMKETTYCFMKTLLAQITESSVHIFDIVRK